MRTIGRRVGLSIGASPQSLLSVASDLSFADILRRRFRYFNIRRDLFQPDAPWPRPGSDLRGRRLLETSGERRMTPLTAQNNLRFDFRFLASRDICRAEMACVR
jgi:hypothetical protein